MKAKQAKSVIWLFLKDTPVDDGKLSGITYQYGKEQVYL